MNTPAARLLSIKVLFKIILNDVIPGLTRNPGFHVKTALAPYLIQGWIPASAGMTKDARITGQV